MQRRAPWWIAMRGAAALALAAFVAPAAQAQRDERAQLRIDAPAEQSTSSLPFVEVRGQAAARPLAAHDLVLVLDVSESSLLPSGWDVDGDGPDGRTDPDWLARLAARPGVAPDLARRLQESDFDDSVLAAELAAASALLERLEAGARYRIGLVIFSDTARVVAPLGASRSALADALRRVRDEFHRDLRGTNFGDAIGAAQQLLQPEVAGRPATPPAGRDQSILLLSDGSPTLPPHGDRARQHALYAASAAAAAGIRVFTFELARDAGKGGVLGEIAQRSAGRFERLDRPGDAIARLRRTDLAGLEELRIVNETTGTAARALRTFPDGSFDAMVELVPGVNRIRVEALTTTGGHAADERVVVRAGDAAGAEERALLEELRRRTQETAIWAEMERERRAPKGELEIRIDPPSGDAGAETPR